MAIPIAAITAIIGGLQAGIGAIQSASANKRLKKLFSQRKAFSTPKEIFDILNMLTNQSQDGYSPKTMQYLTGQAETGLSTTLGTATRLGADPNQLSALLDSYYKDIFKIGAENDLLKMKKFDAVLNATEMVAKNKESEWLSRENILKDQMQAEAQKVGAGQQNFQSGANLGLSSLTTLATEDLWKDQLGEVLKKLSEQQMKVDTSISGVPKFNQQGVEFWEQ